jgi:hypothetical protein
MTATWTRIGKNNITASNPINPIKSNQSNKDKNMAKPDGSPIRILRFTCWMGPQGHFS